MPPSKRNELGNYIRKTRQERGLSLRALATASKLDWSYIGRLEKGEIAAPDPGKLQKLAMALEIDIEDFYALAGYTVPEGLPGLAPYLRVKYDLPEAATGEVERYVARLKRRYGSKTSRSRTQPRRTS
jgi:transcriptional regulator with XRE-family HTH domain